LRVGNGSSWQPFVWATNRNPTTDRSRLAIRILLPACPAGENVFHIKSSPAIYSCCAAPPVGVPNRMGSFSCLLPSTVIHTSNRRSSARTFATCQTSWQGCGCGLQDRFNRKTSVPAGQAGRGRKVDPPVCPSQLAMPRFVSNKEMRSVGNLPLEFLKIRNHARQSSCCKPTPEGFPNPELIVPAFLSNKSA
jgi:hypothetical protein